MISVIIFKFQFFEVVSIYSKQIWSELGTPPQWPDVQTESHRSRAGDPANAPHARESMEKKHEKAIAFINDASVRHTRPRAFINAPVCTRPRVLYNDNVPITARPVHS